MENLKSIIKFVLIGFLVLYVLGIVIGGIGLLTSPPSFASFNDNVTIDIGQVELPRP